MSWMLSCIGCGTKKLPEREESRFLDFQHSLLKAVPLEVFQNERVLQELILDSNQISELPRELFHCHELCILSLSDNELQSLPAAVSSLINLQTLNFCKNGISDISDSIKACKKLARVDASTNPLCRIPEGMTQLVALRELCLNDTFLDYLPANFGRLTGLEVLELRENQLNTLPRSMTRLTALRRLDLGQNEYSELPEVVGHLTSLTDIWFDGNKIKSIPFDIGNLTELHFIDASRNRIREICPEIGYCKKLSDLYLNANELETLPDEICECKQLSILCLDENIISQLPENLGEIDQLTELVVSHNELVELPSSIGLLRELRVLHVNNNLLGHLPSELGSCANLIILTAAHNQIAHLPPELANISRLRVINLCGNQIEFLPVSFTKLLVTGLWLSENQTKPTVTMQCKMDTPSGQKVLTCYMLPQVPYEEKVYKDDSGDLPIAEADVAARRARTLIHFASDKENDEPGLSRTPTPYPKELRALARHTKNLRSLNKTNSFSQNVTVPTISVIMNQPGVNEKELEEISLAKMPKKDDHSENDQDIPLDDLTEKQFAASITNGDVQLVIKGMVKSLVEEKLSTGSTDVSTVATFNENSMDKFVKTEHELPPESNIVTTRLPSEPENLHMNAELNFNTSLEITEEITLSSIRPASIAAPELSKVEDYVVDNLKYTSHEIDWQHHRPGSLASPSINNDSTFAQGFHHLSSSNKFDRASTCGKDINYTLPEILDNGQDDNSVLQQIITTQENEDSEMLIKMTDSVDTTNFQIVNENKNASEQTDSKSSVEINDSFTDYVGNSTIYNVQTKIPLYSPTPNIFYGQSTPQKSTPLSEHTPSKTTNAKTAYQSKLPMIGTSTKIGNTLPETPLGEVEKTRLPMLSPTAKSIKSQKENYSIPPRVQNKKTADALLGFESRIPSFSTKHSTLAMSPVEKPINTTGIPVISPQRHSATNSSLKKKSSIPLSKSKPSGHQVSPTDRALKNPRESNQAWK